MKILVGEILTTHGVRGNVKIKSFSDNKERFEKGSKLFLDDRELVIESSFLNKKNLVIKFEGYDEIGQVEKFIGHELFIDDSQLMKLEEDEFFLFDLEGLDVYENKEKKGFIKEVITGIYPNDIYVIEKMDKKEVWFPALKENVVKIDIENGKIEVKDFEDYE